MRAWGKVCALAVLMAMPAMAFAADQGGDRTSDGGGEEQVVLGCTVQKDYRLADCKVLGSASDAAAKEAISRTNGRLVADRGSPGDHVTVTYLYRGRD